MPAGRLALNSSRDTCVVEARWRFMDLIFLFDVRRPAGLIESPSEGWMEGRWKWVPRRYVPCLLKLWLGSFEGLVFAVKIMVIGGKK